MMAKLVNKGTASFRDATKSLQVQFSHGIASPKEHNKTIVTLLIKLKITSILFIINKKGPFGLLHVATCAYNHILERDNHEMNSMCTQ